MCLGDDSSALYAPLVILSSLKFNKKDKEPGKMKSILSIDLTERWVFPWNELFLCAVLQLALALVTAKQAVIIRLFSC